MLQHWQNAFFVRSLIAALVVIGLSHAVAVPEAVASCGDWLADHSSADNSGLFDPVADSEMPQSCDGPHCRQLPVQQPLPTAPRLLEDIQERWCQLQRLQGRTSAPLLFTQVIQDDALPSYLCAWRLERPPRA